MVRRKGIVIAGVLLLLTDAGRAQQGTSGVPRDQKLTAEQRADPLLRRMTIEEKAMQLSSVFPVGLFGPDGPIPSQLDAQLKDGIGHVAALGLIGHKTPEQIAQYVNAVQRYLVTQTRLKIPAILHNEAMSGVVAPHFTQFPTSIGLAATWDPTATQEMADIIRRQTLLKNDMGLLPLSRDIAKTAIVGPHADDVEAGFTTYMYSAALKMTHARASGGDIAMAGVELGGAVPPEAKAALAAETGAAFKIDRRQYMKSNYAAMSLAEAVRQLLPKAGVTAVAGTGVIPKEPTDIPAAVAAARNADVVILAVGGKSAWSNERTEGESSDTANKDLPPQHVELINAVAALGKPTVAVISMGGPYALGSVIDKLPAVLTDYYGGPHQASALADAIFGVTNPGGKLPFTMPRHVGQVPDSPRPEMGQRLSTHKGGHPQGLSRHAVHAAVCVRPRSQLHHVWAQPVEAREQHGERER